MGFEDRLGAAPMATSAQNGAPDPLGRVLTVCVTPDEFERMSPLPVKQTNESAYENMATSQFQYQHCTARRRRIAFRVCLASPPNTLALRHLDVAMTLLE